MPVLSRYFIRAGLLYFILALLLIGLTQLLSAESYEWLPSAMPVYFHMITVGWITQIIMGVSFWMFPAVNRENPRGRESMGWIAFVALNAGMVLRIIGEPASVMNFQEMSVTFLTVSAILQWIGGLCYVTLIWPRVKGK